MAILHTWTTRITVPGLSSLPADAPLQVSGNTGTEVEAVVAPTTTVEVDIGTVDRTKIVSLVFNADKAALVCNTNTATGTSGQSITLGANLSYVWNNTLNFSNPITTNISKFFLINSGSTAATFRAGILSSV